MNWDAEYNAFKENEEEDASKYIKERSVKVEKQIKGLEWHRNTLPVELQTAALADIFTWSPQSGEHCVYTRRITYHFGMPTSFQNDVCKERTSATYSGNYNVQKTFPPWMNKMIDWLMQPAVVGIKTRPDQANVYLYPPATGILPHYDKGYYGEITSVSLLGTVQMHMNPMSQDLVMKPGSEDEVQHPVASMILFPRDVVVLKDEAQLDWYHSIPKTTVDVSPYTGVRIPRHGTRISIVFRRCRVPDEELAKEAKQVARFRRRYEAAFARAQALERETKWVHAALTSATNAAKPMYAKKLKTLSRQLDHESFTLANLKCSVRDADYWNVMLDVMYRNGRLGDYFNSNFEF